MKSQHLRAGNVHTIIGTYDHILLWLGRVVSQVTHGLLALFREPDFVADGKLKHFLL